MRLTCLAILLITCNTLFAQLNVHINVHPDSIAFLEQSPYDSRDVIGDFTGADEETRYDVDINFRGAYALRYLINRKYEQRNWKVKVGKKEKYRDRREWNYNYEVELRHRLAYDLFATAGVPVVSARNVRLYVNNKDMGLYTEFEDVDNKDWLKEKFGDNDGDLYKASFTIPDHDREFAKLDYLGDNDEDYFLHYRKKTNNKDEAEFDYSSIREFIYQLNFTEDEIFVETLKQIFETDDFIRYLVVQNFISHWDSYPQRPKNYWLYQNPTDNKWSFIPWDLDNTFQLEYGNLNKMGTDCSVFYQFDRYEDIGSKHEQEYNERPLVRRMMKFPEFRNQYVNEYNLALKTYLNPDRILDRIEEIKDEVKAIASSSDWNTFDKDTDKVIEFIYEKYQNVTIELEDVELLPTSNNTKLAYKDQVYISKPFPNPSNGIVKIETASTTNSDLIIETYNSQGQKVDQLTIKPQNPKFNTFNIDLSTLKPGLYFLKIKQCNISKTERIVLM